jgi:hypothetical protein
VAPARGLAVRTSMNDFVCLCGLLQLFLPDIEAEVVVEAEGGAGIEGGAGTTAGVGAGVTSFLTTA